MIDVATTDELLRRLYIQRCCQESRNAITLANLEKGFINIAEISSSPSAAITRFRRKGGLEVEVEPLDVLIQ